MRRKCDPMSIVLLFHQVEDQSQTPAIISLLCLAGIHAHEFIVPVDHIGTRLK